MTINTNMYAIALYEAGLTSNPLDYMTELDTFNDVIDADEAIKKFFFKTYDEFSPVKDILLKDFSSSFVNFIEILYGARMLHDIKSIASQYETLLMENGLLSIVTITSREPLGEDVLEKILNMINSKYPHPFRVSQTIDETLLGGYIIKVNGDIYDTSLKSKLTQIKKLGGVVNE